MYITTTQPKPPKVITRNSNVLIYKTTGRKIII